MIIIQLLDINSVCTHTIMHTQYHTHTHSSYMTSIGVHEMHGRVHPNKCHVTVVDLCSSLAYFMMTHPFPVAGKLPIETLVARQLPKHTHKHTHTNTHTHTHKHTHTHTHTYTHTLSILTS